MELHQRCTESFYGDYRGLHRFAELERCLPEVYGGFAELAEDKILGVIFAHLYGTTLPRRRRERPGRRGETGRAPLQDAAGKASRRVICVHLDGTASPERKVGYQEDNKTGEKWWGICLFCFIPEECLGWKEATIRNLVKIPKEEEFMFNQSKKEEEKKKEPEAVDQLAKELDQIMDILKSFIGQIVERSTRLAESLKKARERREVYEASGSGSFFDYYCGMQGHASTRCPKVKEVIKNGLVRREMTAEVRPAYYLLDNSRVSFDRTRIFRSVVAAHSSKIPLEKFATQVIELEEEDEGRIVEVDLGKRVRVQKKGAAEPGPSRKREKATVVQGEEEVLQRISDEIGEEEEDYEEIQ
ncbi:hypothetical protein BY996DRAFT_6515037 [Phakopsora pachyrhizi]|nr:hypothetical protein BY996DRAFT_6515037 [Phakopsora pachyrhizi]